MLLTTLSISLRNLANIQSCTTLLIGLLPKSSLAMNGLSGVASPTLSIQGDPVTLRLPGSRGSNPLEPLFGYLPIHIEQTCGSNHSPVNYSNALKYITLNLEYNNSTCAQLTR